VQDCSLLFPCGGGDGEQPAGPNVRSCRSVYSVRKRILIYRRQYKHLYFFIVTVHSNDFSVTYSYSFQTLTLSS
jgi:hypothetical protein